MKTNSGRMVFGAVNLIIFMTMGFIAVQADTTDTLPQGRGDVTVGYISDHLRRQFDDKGQNREVGFWLNNQNITSLATPIFNTMFGLPAGTPSVTLAKTSLDGNIDVRAWMLGFDWGITDDLSVGVGFPYYVYAHTQANFKVALYPNTALGLPQGPLDMTSVAQSFLHTQFGYHKIRDWGGSPGIGDITVGAKWRFLNTDNFKAATGFIGTIPTGRVDDERDLTDIAYGNGYYALGVYGMVDLVPVEFMTWNFTGRYFYTFPFNRAIYVIDPTIPAFAKAELPTKRVSGSYDAGDYYDLETELHLRASDSLSGFIGYCYTQRWDARIDGNHVPISNTLERKTWYGATYSTVKKYQADNAPVPFELSVWYQTDLTGKNIYSDDRWIATLKFFF